jgi:hypothetical protein
MPGQISRQLQECNSEQGDDQVSICIGTLTNKVMNEWPSLISAVNRAYT